MSPRQMRVTKGERYHNVNMEIFIERVRKARALGCNLSYLGIDDQNFNKPNQNRTGSLLK